MFTESRREKRTVDWQGGENFGERGLANPVSEEDEQSEYEGGKFQQHGGWGLLFAENSCCWEKRGRSADKDEKG